MTAVAVGGDADRAEQIARSITNPDQQARALTAAAEAVGLAQCGQLLGVALAVGHWTVPLQILAKLRPETVFKIADETFGNDGYRYN